MVTYRPLIYLNGRIAELQNSDTLENSSASDILLSVSDEGSQIKTNINKILFNSAGFDIQIAQEKELKIIVNNGGNNPFNYTYPILSSFSEASTICTNNENYTITENSNDKLLLNIDNCGSVTITLKQGTKTAQSICDEINLTLNCSYLYHNTYEYAIVENSKIKLRSLNYVKTANVIISAITNSCYSTLGFSTGTYSASENNKIKIYPFNIKLEDGTVLNNDIIKIIDFTSSDNLNPSTTITTDQWLYLYVTDDSNYINNIMISHVAPNAFGYFTGINCKYIGSIKTTSTSTLRSFLKIDNTVFMSEKTIYNATKNTTVATLNVSSEIPPTTRIVRLYPYSSTSSAGRAFLYSWGDSSVLGSLQVGFGLSSSVKNHFTDENFLVRINGNNTNYTLKSYGYLENIHNPII